MTIITKPWPYDCMPDVMKAIEFVRKRRYVDARKANKYACAHKRRTYGAYVVVDIADYDE